MSRTLTPEVVLAHWCGDPLAEPITFEIDRLSAFTLVGLLQLALRHPELDGHPAETARFLIQQFQSVMPDEVLQLSRLGDDQEHDGRRCRECGCTTGRACVVDGRPCHWVERDLCSACAPTIILP